MGRVQQAGALDHHPHDGPVLSLGNIFSASGADKFVTNLFMGSGVATSTSRCSC
ncbi:MAG: hypothetical protein V8S24_16185 [Gordonibacter pamelaeae]